MRWTASVSDPQPPAPAATTFVEPQQTAPQQTAPQQYVQQPFRPAAPAGTGLALTRRQLREQSDQLALAASTPQQADTGVIARSAHAAEPMPQASAPVEQPVAEVGEAPVEPAAVDTSAADAAAAALVAAAIASPEPVAAPAAAVPFDWSPNAVMPTRAEAPVEPVPAPVEVAPEPVAVAAPKPVVAPVPVSAPVAAPVTVAAMSDVAVVEPTAPAEPLSNYAALAALFGSVENQNPEPQWETEKPKNAVAQFDYAASFAQQEGTPGYAPFGGVPAAEVAAATPAPSRLPVNTGAIWIFAIMPILQVGLAWLAFDYLGLTAGGIPLLGFLAAQFVLYLVLAGIDRRSLSTNGHPKVPSILWAIVPLFYLIARIVRTGRRSVAPLLVWLLTQGAIVAASVLLAMPLILTLMAMSPGITSEAPATSNESLGDSVVLTQAQSDALLTPEGATAYANSLLVIDGVVPTDLSCQEFLTTDPGATTSCTYTQDGIATVYPLTLGRVVIAP